MLTDNFLKKLKRFSIYLMSKAVFLSIVLVLIVSSVWAQSLSDLKNLKVDNLSDAQIEQLIKRAESSGLTSSQMEAMAREQGLSPVEANKLRERILGLKRSAAGGDLSNSPLNTGRSWNDSQASDPFDSLRTSDPYYDLTPFQKKIFGYKLFHSKGLDFNPSLNIPTPLNYVIGAGDQLLIDVYGASQQSFDLTVSPEGRILVPSVGPVQVGGSTIEAAVARLKTQLGRIYSGLLGSNPNTFLQVRLGNIRSIKVSMVGELSKPGTYTLPSFATVFNGLYAAGGPNENGAFRNIQVYRSSRLVATVDIYEFLAKGEQSSNITLQDNDVVIVPPVDSRVEISGPVRREGFFEVKAGESLKDLYIYTGGFQPNAYTSRITVRRIEDNAKKVIDVPQAEFDSFHPLDGDEILIGEAMDRFTNRVQISGAVFRPGEYALEESGLTIRQLIEKADGLKQDAFSGRATLYRTSDDLTLAAMPLDLKGILDGSVQDVVLKNEDLLFVPSRYDIREEYYVKVSGEVNFPGTYPFASEMTIGDLVLRAGGLLESASNSSLEIARRVRDASTGKIAEIITLNINADLKLSPEEINTRLSPFDHIFIRRKPGFVQEQLITLRGEVRFPGDYAISSANERISDMIKRAGGFSDFAYPKGASLIRRTAYYKGKSEEEIKEARLKQMRDNLDPEINRNANEAEQILFERIVKKLERLEEEKQLEEKKRTWSMTFTDPALSDSLRLDSALHASRYKEEDLVGINLEYIMKNPGSDADLILFEGDVLQIPKQLQTVRMVGEVLLPTTTRFENGKRLKHYISRAGGFTENARRSKSYVIYANGDAAQTRSFLGLKNYPSLEPGAEIVVPQKPERTRMSAAGWIGIASSLATLGILLDRLISQ